MKVYILNSDNGDGTFKMQIVDEVEYQELQEYSEKNEYIIDDLLMNANRIECSNTEFLVLKKLLNNKELNMPSE